MTVFKVYYEIDNSRVIMPVNAGTPDEASNIIRKRAPGAIVTKVKVDKSGNRSGFIPFYKPGEAEKITEMARAKLASIDDIVNGRAKLGINPDAKPVSMTPEDAAKLDWVAIGDPRSRHH